MRLSLLTSLCLTAIGALSQQTPGTYTPAPPPPPGLTFLYTCYAICDNRLYTTQGPRGLRTTIPIIGGNFTGPRLRGQILDVGADWGVTDPQTGIFSADTRYNFLTDDGANIFLQTSGPAQPDGSLHLRGVFETGDKNYYWLNNIVAVGVLNAISSTNTTFTLRIDMWHLASDWNSTTFYNGSTYPAQASRGALGAQGPATAVEGAFGVLPTPDVAWFADAFEDIV